VNPAARPVPRGRNFQLQKRRAGQFNSEPRGAVLCSAGRGEPKDTQVMARSPPLSDAGPGVATESAQRSQLDRNPCIA